MKKKILITIGIVIFIIAILILIRFNIYMGLDNKYDEMNAKNNYYFYSETAETIMTYWKKDNIHKVNMKSVKGESDLTFWKNGDTNEYYMFYETGVDTPIEDWDDEPLKVNAENFSVGADMAFNIGQYIYGLNSIVIRAFSNNPNITASSFSNSVTSTW